MLDESHLSIIAKRCPNIKLLVLRPDPRASLRSLESMKSLGEFSNLVILDFFCTEVIPPLSQLRKLRELVLFVTHSFTRNWCRSLCRELPPSVKFLSLDSVRPAIALVYLGELQLTALKVYARHIDFQSFCEAFPSARDNPKHMIVETSDEILYNGIISPTTFLTCPNLSAGSYLTYA